jgi:phosphoenolpyruvate synthase/pyruvate phosphate dikinase
VAGVITTDFQTPLSHITLLCMNRGTPMAAVKKAWDDSLLRSMEGLPIYFQVNNDGLKVEKVSKELVDSSFSTSKLNQEKIILDKDTTFYGLLTPQEMEGKLAIVGGKAAHFGELHTAVKKLKLEAKLPEDAFAIPFAFYESHIKEGGIDKLIQVLPNMVLENDQETLKEQLDYIQYKIKRLPLSQELLELVKKKVAQSSFQKFRFRSSTNAEDIEGFNGAGLYTSKSAELNNPSKSIEKAIKKVWASTWSYKAFMERSYFGIDQKSVAMAILCHRSFPGESANGVVITKNLYRKNYRGFVVNAQKGDVSVVKPPIDVTCEQLICYSDKDDAFYGEKEIVEYISYSNILEPSEKSVLSTDEVIDLTRCLSKIKKYMYQRNKKALRKTPYHEYGLDFEFKLFGKTRQLYIKQMRPF